MRRCSQVELGLHSEGITLIQPHAVLVLTFVISKRTVEASAFHAASLKDEEDPYRTVKGKGRQSRSGGAQCADTRRCRGAEGSFRRTEDPIDAALDHYYILKLTLPSTSN